MSKLISLLVACVVGLAASASFGADAPAAKAAAAEQTATAGAQKGMAGEQKGKSADAPKAQPADAKGMSGMEVKEKAATKKKAGKKTAAAKQEGMAGMEGKK